jgi:uncharacterized lipoprotein YddW (UPF0748 family)
LPGGTVQALTPAGTGSNLSRPDFVRAIWVDAAGTALHSADTIKKLVADCRAAGFDTIYAQVRANGDALYTTQLAPRQQNLPAGLDPLKLLIEEAKAGPKPLQVHALLVTYRVWSYNGEPTADHVSKQHPDWLTLAEDGSRQMENNETWLDPGNTAVQDHLALIATDLVKNYAVDGVQLDRIRYPELDLKKYPNGKLGTGYNQAAVDRYNQEKGKTGRPAPTDPDWVNWRRDQVTATVQKIRDAVRAVRPNAQISAGAVTFGAPPASRDDYMAKSTPYTGVLEDWVGWSEKGLIDANVLMDFKRAEDRTVDFEGWQNFALKNKGKAKVVIGVGGWLNEPRYTVAHMLMPVFLPAADGVALYGYNDTYRGEQYDRNLTYVQPALDAAALSAKAGEISAAAAKPLGDAMPGLQQLAKLDAIITAAGISSPAAAAAATPATAVASLPTLGSSAGAPKLPQLGSSSSPNMPSLSAASSNAPGNVAGAMPALPGSASTASTGAGGLPSLSAATGTGTNAAAALPALPGAGAAASSALPPLSSATGSTASLPPLGSVTGGNTAGLPSLPAGNTAPPALPALGSSSGSAPANTAAQMPALPGAGTSAVAVAPAPSTASNAMPSLPGASAAAPAATTLPPLGSVAATAPESMPSLNVVSPAPAPGLALPALPSSDATVASVPAPAPALPSLSAPALPNAPNTGALAVPSTTPEAQKLIPQAPDLVAPLAPSNPLGTPIPGLAMPAAPAGVVPPSADAAVTIEPPLGTPITSIAPIPSGPPTTTLSVPGTSAKTTVNIPSMGGSTNFDGKPIGSAAPASPLITPPTVLTPAPGQTNEGQPINVGKQTVMDAPKVQRMDYSERQSAYGTPNPATEIRNYTTANIRKEKNDIIAMPPAPAPLEVIVLKTGKEFAGRVLQRGTVWRIQLPNGSVLTIAGDRIASTRSTESSSLTVSVTPVPL